MNKRNIHGSIDRYKARFVANNFTQKECIDYHKMFSPVSRKISFRIIIVLAAYFNLKLH